MDLTMVEFNSQFKKYMNDVKILEKTHPRESIGLWVQVCQFIVNFAKSPNCPRTLRPKLVSQADSIIVKVKHMQQGHISSVFSSDVSEPQGHISSNLSGNASSEKPIGDHSDSESHFISKLNALPDIPSEEIEDPISPMNSSETQYPEVNKLDNSDKNSSPPPDDDASVTRSIGDQTSQSKFDSAPLDDLKKLEEELKQMPSNMREISPSPFANRSIIPDVDTIKNEVDLDSFKQETTFLDITNTSQPGDNNSMNTNPTLNSKNEVSPRVAGFSKDPLQFDAAKKDIINDPFSSVSNEDKALEGGNQRSCFACGGILEDSSVKCPFCGTENPLN